jgi:DNA polymerase IIIc chi subunit
MEKLLCVLFADSMRTLYRLLMLTEAFRQDAELERAYWVRAISEGVPRQ